MSETPLSPVDAPETVTVAEFRSAFTALVNEVIDTGYLITQSEGFNKLARFAPVATMYKALVAASKDQGRMINTHVESVFYAQVNARQVTRGTPMSTIDNVSYPGMLRELKEFEPPKPEVSTADATSEGQEAPNITKFEAAMIPFMKELMDTGSYMSANGFYNFRDFQSMKQLFQGCIRANLSWCTELQQSVGHVFRAELKSRGYNGHPVDGFVEQWTIPGIFRELLDSLPSDLQEHVTAATGVEPSSKKRD